MCPRAYQVIFFVDLISVAVFEISTLSPFFTVKSTFFPLSSILPVA